MERGSQFTLDYGDIDEDFYIILEDVFEDILMRIRNLIHVVFALYEQRLHAIEKAVVVWGGDIVIKFKIF